MKQIFVATLRGAVHKKQCTAAYAALFAISTVHSTASRIQDHVTISSANKISQKNNEQTALVRRKKTKQTALVRRNSLSGRMKR